MSEDFPTIAGSFDTTYDTDDTFVVRLKLENLPTYSISGRVTDGSNIGISGVSISDGAGHTATTDGSGNYTLNGLVAGTYTLTPSKNGYTFSPASRAVTVPPDATGQNFTASLVAYSISGRVADGSNNSILGVTISDGVGHTTTTDSNGNYTLSGLAAGTYTITPSKSGYTFSPASRAVTVPPDGVNQNFTAQAITFSISGVVVDGSNNGISGVSISDGAGHTATTDNSGNYTLSGLAAGTYTITPSKSGYTFSRASRAVTIPPDASGQNFTGTPIYDIGFLPDPNGYQFSNIDLRWLLFTNGDFTTDDMRRMFGDSAVCIMNGSECKVKEAARDWWKTVNNKMNGGHCDGFSTTSLRFFKGLDNVETFQNGAIDTHDLNLGNARRHIAYYWALQVSNPVALAMSQAWAQTPIQVLAQLQSAMSGGAPDPTTLIIYTAQKGHSIVPYALQDRGNDVWWVSVYDNNYPDDANRHVVITTTTNTWSYDMGGSIGTWSGDANTHSLGAIPISRYAEQPVCPWCTTTTVDQLWLAGQGNLLITDSQGRRIGYAGSQFVNEIPDAYANVIPGGLGTPNEPVYYLPIAETYTILLDGQTLNEMQTTQTEPSSVRLYGPDYAASVDGVTLTSASHDLLSISADGKQLEYQPNMDEEVTLSLMLDGTSESSEFQIAGTDIGSGQTVRLTNNTSNNQFVVNNSLAGGGTYDLLMVQVNSSGEHTFVHKGITILASDTQYASYGAWEGGLGTIALLIDHGSNGTIDETVVLNNQAFLIYLPLVLR